MEKTGTSYQSQQFGEGVGRYKVSRINMIKRKSKTCPPYCDNKGCYDVFEKIKIADTEQSVWTSRCKELSKCSKKAVKLIN